MGSKCETVCSINDILTENIIKNIIQNSGFIEEEIKLNKYTISKASDKMLGFLADYFKLKIEISKKNYSNNMTLNFFIKTVSQTNKAKADMVNEMKLFEKEKFFYTTIKKILQVPGIQPWSPKFVATLNDGMVFEDLNALQYTVINKFLTFDEIHTFTALKTLARFHASSIMYEETKTQQLNRTYYINDDYHDNLNRGGYRKSDFWYVQCMKGALEAIKSHSKYRHNRDILKVIERNWECTWYAALDLSDFSSQYRNVICHRDLWNNNILFKYENFGSNSVPIECVLVDFQAVRCQPPAGDVMLLLYCNLEPTFREQNMNTFLSYYYKELETILNTNGFTINNILTRKDFFKCCKEQRLWGLVVSACLVPQFWLDDDLTKTIFSDTSKFQEILTKDKGIFIKSMIEKSNGYKNKVLQIFEEIVERYCLENY